MGLPKIIKDIKLTPEKILMERREELLDDINRNGTFLPKSILHADLDRGFLDFVKNDLALVVDGAKVPFIDVIITTQNWVQFADTWKFQNIDDNPEPPFITVVRKRETKFGTHPSLMYNIPNRKQYFYAAVPTWNGTRKGVDIYTIPQPIPINISYNVKIVCSRMRELNEFNRIVLGAFASRQAYSVIKGHYIPIIMNEITDESINDLDKRRYYVQSYDFTLVGFLIDENEFEVKPAISRSLVLTEFDKENPMKKNGKKRKTNDVNTNSVIYNVGVDQISQPYFVTTDIKFLNTINVESYDVYINDNLYGTNLNMITLNNSDVLRIDIIKTDGNEISKIEIESNILS